MPTDVNNTVNNVAVAAISMQILGVFELYMPSIGINDCLTPLSLIVKSNSFEV